MAQTPNQIVVHISYKELVAKEVLAKIAAEFAEYLETIGWEIAPKKGREDAGLDYEELASQFAEYVESYKDGQLR